MLVISSKHSQNNCYSIHCKNNSNFMNANLQFFFSLELVHIISHKYDVQIPILMLGQINNYKLTGTKSETLEMVLLGPGKYE